MPTSSTTEFANYESIILSLLSTIESQVLQRRLEGQTCEAIGLGFNLTRQRINQIEKKAVLKLRRHEDLFANYLWMIESHLNDKGGILTTKEATDSLREAGLITEQAFRDVNSILKLSEAIKIETQYNIYDNIIATEARYIEFKAIEKEQSNVIDRVASVLKNSSGIISVQYQSISSIVSYDLLIRLLEKENHELRIFSAEGSMWLTWQERRCHLLTQATKVFCICNECEISLLSSQLQRSLKARLFEGRKDLANHVIDAWIRTSEHFQVQGSLVFCNNKGQLSEDEEIMVQMFRKKRIWSYVELRDALEGVLTNESVNRILQQSPLIICDKSGGRKKYAYQLLQNLSGDNSNKYTAPSTDQVVDLDSEDLTNAKIVYDPPSSPHSSTLAQRATTAIEYQRNPRIVEYVLSQASGICECCQKSAPFLRDDLEPYLEVHHVKMLSEGGSDTISNAIAVCPNCHRQLHHGINRLALRSQIYATVDRLIRE